MHNFPFAFSMMQLIDTLSQQVCMIIKRDQSWVYTEKSCFLISLFRHNVTPEDSLWVYRKKFALRILIFRDLSI